LELINEIYLLLVGLFNVCESRCTVQAMYDLWIFLKSKYPPTNTLNKIQFRASIRPLHVSPQGSHPQGVKDYVYG
jgi:hypothetical protein